MAYRDEVLADSPVAYWRLEETSGSTVSDETGSHDATASAGVNLDVAGKVGSAAEFSSDEEIEAPDPILTVEPIAIECWIRGFDTDSQRAIGGNRDGSGDGFEGCMLALNVDQTLKYVAFGQGGADSTITVPDDGEYHHVVASVAPDGTVTFYVDAGSGESFGNPTMGQSDSVSNWRFGRNGNTGNYWRGFLDECALYTTELSAARVQAHYDAATATAVAAQPATVAAAAQPPTVNVARIISAQPATIAAAAQAADVSVPVAVQAQPATSTVAAQAADVPTDGTSIAAQPATLTTAAQAPTVSLGALAIAAQPATLNVAAQAATVALGALAVSAQPASITAGAQQASVNGVVSVQAQPATVTASAQAALPQAGAVTVNGQPATLTVTPKMARVVAITGVPDGLAVRDVDRVTPTVVNGAV